ncbi:GPI anchored serine-threonine rich protein [Pyrenophora tritici-repentis]|nr:GPI anchored serine-threonine rich protein [Pyrenophora tritici-repentis]
MRKQQLGGFRTFTAARLDDEDILASNTLFNLNSCLTALELVKKHLGLGYAKVVADGPAIN